MGYPRARLVDFSSPGYYHCISRCVRRGFLCGDQYEHRRQWIEERIAELLGVFAIDARGYTIMSNHFHLVLRTNPEASRKWSPLEVARRWVRLFPVSRIESQVCVQDRRIQDRRIEGSHFLGRRKIVTFLSFCSVDTA